jgi:translation elongation factor EF-1beta
MATIIIGMTVRPNMDNISDIEELNTEVKSILSAFLNKELTERDLRVEILPLAFGLKELHVTFMAPGNMEQSKLEDMFTNSEKVESMSIDRFDLTTG